MTDAYRQLRIVFMGTPEFAVPPLLSLVVNAPVPCEVLVVTQPDRPVGRRQELTPPPVKVAALAHNLHVIQPERIRGNDAFRSELRAFAPDLLIVAAYGKILPPDILAIPRIAPINLHASLLPAYRGASPIQAAILDGCPETGVSVMRMDEGLDTGDVLDAPYAMPRCPITADDTTATLTPRLAGMASASLLSMLADARRGALTFRPQGEPSTPLTRPLTKEDGLLRFDAEDAARAACRVRSMDPWPGAWVPWQGAPLKIWRAEVHEDFASAVPGTVLPLADGRCTIKTREGCLTPLVVQAPGKKRLPVGEFLRGARKFIGSSLAAPS